MDQSNSTSVDSKTGPGDSVDLAVLKSTIILGLLTVLSLECTAWIFKLDKDLGQIFVYPLILIAYIYLFRNYLPKIVSQALLSTLILLIFSFFWAQGDFGTRGVSYISKLLVGSANPKMEQLRADFNRDSEVLNFPKLETVYRNFDDKSADEWGQDSYRLLIYSDPSNPRLKLFLKDLSKPMPVEVNGIELQIQLFPEWVPINPQGIPVDYLTSLTRILPSLDHQKDALQKLEDLGFAGYAAGLTRGRWNSPTPRAAALLLGASANLAKDKVLGKAELKCIQDELIAVLQKTKVSDSPELRALALNNLGVAILKLDFLAQIKNALPFARKLFLSAALIRATNGSIVNGSRLAMANLFALNGAGFTSRFGHRYSSRLQNSRVRRLKHTKSVKKKKPPTSL